MSIWILVLTFYTWIGNAPALTALAISVHYETPEVCNASGEAARHHFNGGAKVEWTCVEAPATAEDQKEILGK